MFMKVLGIDKINYKNLVIAAVRFLSVSKRLKVERGQKKMIKKGVHKNFKKSRFSNRGARRLAKHAA